MLLFDVVNDPNEMIDLVENKDYVPIKLDLIERFKNQQKIMEDPLDLHPYFPEIF
jgi:hypothetical protein